MPPATPHFVDQLQRTWRLVLNFHLATRLRDELGLDFVNYHDGKALLAIHDSDEKLVSALWVLCEAQAENLGVAPEDFAAGLGGDALEQALTALEDALLAFSRPAKRQALTAIRDKAHQVVKAQADLITTKVNGGKFQKAIEQKLRQVDSQIDRALESSTSGDLPLSALPSPASTSARTRSAK